MLAFFRRFSKVKVLSISRIFPEKYYFFRENIFFKKRKRRLKVKCRPNTGNYFNSLLTLAINFVYVIIIPLVSVKNRLKRASVSWSI